MYCTIQGVVCQGFRQTFTFPTNLANAASSAVMYESGLILAIYNRTLQQTFQEYKVYDAVVKALHGDREVKIDVN